jgi:hypothetical protein
LVVWLAEGGESGKSHEFMTLEHVSRMAFSSWPFQLFVRCVACQRKYAKRFNRKKNYIESFCYCFEHKNRIFMSLTGG